VIAGAEGNPLFLEEMVALARERGSVVVPPTIQALLAARLERLEVEEREVLERGAVEGEVFHRLAVKALADDRLDVESPLAGLVRKELIRPHPAMLKGDEAFRFRHLLIRDAAYDALPKSTRATLHERFAIWLEQHGTDLLELDEIAGWHLEQAARYQRELGRGVDHLASGAAEHLYASGTRAVRRGDVAAASNLLRRALALTQPQDSLHALIALGLAESLADAGDFAATEELLPIAEADSATAPMAALIRVDWMRQTRLEEFSRRAATLLPATTRELERRGDKRWLAKAHLVASWPHWMACRASATAAELRKAAEYARAAGDEGLRAVTLGHYLVARRLGVTPAIEIGREVDAIEREEPGPYLAAQLDHVRGNLAMFAARFEEARSLMSRGAQVEEALGQHMVRAVAAQELARLELAAGNPAGARDVLLDADTILAASGERGVRSTTQAKLAVAYEQLGERDAALAAMELAEALGGKDDLINFVITHSVRARLALADGDHAAAGRWARSAGEYAARTDFVLDQAETKLELARVLAAGGKPDEAVAEAQEALELFEAKGDQPNAAKARGLLDDLDSR
jgi:tetratricopeptide (TPR) repeat protein